MERSFSRMEGRSQKFSKRLGGNMAGFGKAGAAGAAIAGTALITKGLQASVKAALEAEKAQTRLQGALKSAGATQGAYVRAQQQISKVSKDAALDDEDLSDALANLTRTTGSVQKGIKGMALAANIARARNISLASAAKIVEKAHVGQFRGLKAVGVQIGKNTSSTEAIERAQRKFAGSAAAYGKSAAGAQDKLAVAFENLQEKIGAKLLPVLTELNLKLVRLIDWTETNWPRISKSLKPVVAVVKAAFQEISGVVKAFAATFEGIVRIIEGIKNGKWSQVWSGLKQLAVDGVAGVVLAVAKLPILIAQKLGRAAFKGLEQIGTFIGDAIMTGLRAVLNKAIDLINSVIGKINDISGKLSKVVPGNLPKIDAINKIVDRESRQTRRRPPSTTPIIRGRGGANFDPRTISFVPRDRSLPPVHVHLDLDGKQVSDTVIVNLQKKSDKGAASTRGRFSGRNLGLG